MKLEAQLFEITSPTKKISLNYHLNKFSIQLLHSGLRHEMRMILKKVVLNVHDPIT